MKDKIREISIDISWNAIFKLLGLAAAIWLAFILREVILLIFGVFMFIAVVNPTIMSWQKRMSRLLAVVLLYALIVIVVAILMSVLVPNLVFQLNELAHSLPAIATRGKELFITLRSGQFSPLVDQFESNLSADINNFSNGLFDFTLTIFNNVALVITGLVICFYLLLEEKNAQEFLHQVLPHNRFEPVYHTLNKISERMGSWVRGQLTLMIIIAASNLVAFLIVGVHAPLPLALWSGLCEILPYIGPILGMLPALIVAFSTGSLLQVVLILVLSGVVIYQIEAHLVVPRVMGKAVGLSPVLVILAILIGVKLLGLLGAIVAVPVAAIVSVIVGEWPQLRTLWEIDDKEFSREKS